MTAQTIRLATSTPRLMAILYRSEAGLTRAEFEASGAPTEFAIQNRRQGITGYLHLEDGQFYQHLEGPAEAVMALWGKVRTDARHHAVTEISRATVATRRFDRWAMGYNAAEPRSLQDWTARSGLSLKGPKYPQIVTAFLEYASAGTRMAG